MMPTPTTYAPRSGERAVVEAQLGSYRSQVTPLLLDTIPRGEPRKHLYDLVEMQLQREGKGIRPALCLATCSAFGGDAEQALPSAAALELLHNAFLVHDDIEDSSDYRRGKPTLHREYGIPLAVNVGDAMNAMSARLLKQNLTLLGPELGARIFDEFDHMSTETIEGQAMELGWIRDNDCSTTEEDYLLMVLKKTGWYSFIHPMRIGALIAQPERNDLDVFNRFGYYLGTAFQIQDDVLNLTGSREKYGKEIGGDLLEGKRTLILAHLFQQVSTTEKARLSAFFGKPRAQRLPRDMAWVYELLETYKSIDYARGAARTFAEGARSELDTAYAGAKPGPDFNLVRSLLDYVLTREA
jgi:geranylgeranyl diphosphate synthase type II